MLSSKSFLKIIDKCNALGRRLHSTTLLSEEETIEDRTEKFRQEIKTPFLQDLMQEIDLALKINDEVLLAFNMSNTKATFSEEETWINLQWIILWIYSVLHFPKQKCRRQSDH